MIYIFQWFIIKTKDKALLPDVANGETPFIGIIIIDVEPRIKQRQEGQGQW